MPEEPVSQSPNPAIPPPPATSLPKNEEERRILMMMQSLSMTYTGPVPPPSILKEYDQLVPGSAKRMLDEAERQTHHRQDLEKRVVISDILNSKLGIVCAFVLSMFVFYISYKAIMSGHSLAGTCLGTANVGTLAAIFIYGSQKKSAELAGRKPQKALEKKSD